MCGIVGCFDRRGARVEAGTLARMTELLAHRGPDDHGLWCGGAIGLGHRRLAIRDLSSLGRQPLADRSGRVVISYNGEIYNDEELRRELSRDHGVVFRSSCDAETIPYAFIAWGERAFERLEGMFAIALWDDRSATLHLARDGIGIKPLFYADDGPEVVFASEAKAIFAHPGIARAIEPAGLHALLATGYAGPDASLYAGLRQVPPGSVVSFTAASSRAWRFWAPRRQPRVHRLEDALSRLDRTLSQVVESQIVADVRLGVLQSGGIDSTLVTLAAARRVSDIPIFTAGFRQKSYDETALAGMVVRVVGGVHHVVPVEDETDTESAFRSLAYHSDGQCADTGMLAAYRLYQAVRGRTTVALSGDGGDEFFAGYSTYAATWATQHFRGAIVRRLAERAGRALYATGAAAEGRLPPGAALARLLLGIGAGDAPPHLQWRRLLPRPLLASVYGPGMGDLGQRTPYAAYQAAFDEGDADLLDRALVADQRYHLQSVLMKVDTMSMAHSLEVRVPLLDRRIMDLAGSLSLGLLRPRLGPGKYVLRQLARRLGAPAAVVSGRKKGFNVPIATLMRRQLAPLGDAILDRDADVLAPFIKPDGLRRLWRAHRRFEANHAFALWPLFVLAVYWSGAARPAPTVAVARPALPLTAPGL